MARRVVCPLVLLAVTALAAPLLPALDLDVNTGMLLIGTTPPAGSGGPNPAITYTLGVSLPLPIAGVFFVEPMIEAYGLYYEWVDAASVAVPTGEEAGLGFFTLASLVSLHAGVQFPVSTAITLGGDIGLDFLFRIPVVLSSDLPSAAAGRTAAVGYFYSLGRFFYPETRLFLRWKFADWLTLTGSVRAFYPVFHLWDGMGQSFVDQFMIAGSVGFGIRLGSAPAPQPAS